MPRWDWDSAANRFVADTLPSTPLAPTAGNDLCNKTYVDLAVGGAALFMSQYATPQLAVAAAIASGVNAIFVDDVFTITVPVNLNSDGLALIGLGEDTGFIVNDAAAIGALTIPNANVVVKDISIAVTNCVAAANIISVTGNRCRLEGIRMTFAALVVAARGIDFSGATDCILQNIVIDGTGATLGYGIYVAALSHRLTLRGVVVDTVSTDCVYIDSLNAHFEDLRLLNAGQFGLYAPGIAANVLRLKGIYVYNSTSNGMVIYCEWIGTNIEINTSGNHGLRCGMNITDPDPGFLPPQPSSVSGIRILNSTGYGILHFRGEMGSFDITGFSSYGIRSMASVFLSAGWIAEGTNAVTGIYLEDSLVIVSGVVMYLRGQGIQLDGNDNWVIQGCSIWRDTAATGPGIFVTNGADGGVISGNRIEGFTEGIYIDAGAGNSYQAIAGNMIESCPVGIRVGAATTHISVTGNTLRACTTGVQLAAAALYVTVSGNDISGGTTAVSLVAGTDHCVVSNNTIYNPSADGIYLADCDYCVVEGNVIDTCGDNGIELDGNSTRNKVGDNVTSTCTTDGIFLDDTCDYNLVGLNQVPDGLTMGAGVNNEHYHNMV